VPTLRVLSGGRLVLNAAAQRMIGDTTFVQLLSDPDTKRVRIKPTMEYDHLAFRVTTAPSQSIITSNAFVIEHKLAGDRNSRILLRIR